MKRTARNGWRLSVVLAGVAAMIVLPAVPAAAHVSVNPKAATAGGFVKLTFGVPNESDTDSTVKLEVAFPQDAPFASASVKDVPGWTVAVEKRQLTTPIKNHGSDITEVVSKIAWTADAGTGIKPGQFMEFDVSVGPVPEVSQVIFKALQTYSDGVIVRWIDEPRAGAELEHPAPVLKVLPKADPTVAAPVASTSTSDGGSGAGWAIGISVAALLVALATLGMTLRRRAAGAA